LQFIQRYAAEQLPKRDYLLRVWDMALAAGGIEPRAKEFEESNP